MRHDLRPLNAAVVKLGGSLAGTPQCAAWLDALAAWGSPLILVPGGGAFADCVRAAQAAMRLSDAAAHHMALLAMGQFGIALADHSDTFAVVASDDELDNTLRSGRIPVWLPEKMVLKARNVPACWEVTSDSLAAWLAAVYGVSRLLLIKSCDIKPPVSAFELAAAKIVDPAFPHFAAQAQAQVWVAGPASLAGAVPLLQAGGMPGSLITIGQEALN
jgi:dihydroneopterin aldolase